MSTSQQGKSLLRELSDNLADAVARAANSTVRVSARRRFGATGVVWSAEGLIVTADHVIEREDDIKVGLPDGQEVPARLVGRDAGTDLAVVKVDGQSLTPIQRSSNDFRIGHLVLALGRPQGGQPMATIGVVSAVSGPWRTWRGGTLEQVIRSDVTLYPGFSGGPLVDPEGNLAGINTSVLSRGLPVTIPVAVVERVAEALVSQGKVKRGYIGIATQPVALPESLRQSLGLAQESGLLIVGVEPGSPAEQAGLFLGDVVIAFAGRTTSDIQALQDALGPGSAGTQQTARVVRGGTLTEVTVTVGER